MDHDSYCGCSDCALDATADNVPYAGEEVNEVAPSWLEIELAPRPIRESVSELILESVCLLAILGMLVAVVHWFGVGR